LSAIIRYAAWQNWGEKGWYDACMVTLALPLWHYGVEKAVFGSPTWAQMAMAYTIDGGGFVWMWLVRNDVLGL